MTAEDVLLALAACGCPATRVGRLRWEATCPACGRVHAVELRVSATGLYRLQCLAGCPPRDLLRVMGTSS